MTTLAEVRERDAGTRAWTNQQPCHGDVRFLLSQLDALQKERDEYKAVAYSDIQEKLIEALQKELSHLQAAVKAAGPALEAGIRAIERDALYADDIGTKWYLANERGEELRRCANELRTLLGGVT